MKKTILLLFLFIYCLGFSQVSVFEAKRTTDRAVVEQFIRDNPNHPAVPELKQRALTLRYGRTSQPTKPAIVPATGPNSGKTAIAETSTAKGEPSEQAKNTAAVLTSLFNNDPNKKEVIVQFINKSKCVLDIKITGKKLYNLMVPAGGQNYILVDKGDYNITTSVCDADYNSNKTVSKDIIITLNPPK